MSYDSLTLSNIYDKTNGCCHICHKKLAFSNYGKHGAKASWYVDHSNPKAKGGSNHFNNLLPACIPCNLEKSTVTTRTARSWKGKTRAPLSKKGRQEVRNKNALNGAAIGGFVGLIGGSVGAAVGAAIGGIIGYDQSPKR